MQILFNYPTMNFCPQCPSYDQTKKLLFKSTPMSLWTLKLKKLQEKHSSRNKSLDYSIFGDETARNGPS